MIAGCFEPSMKAQLDHENNLSRVLQLWYKRRQPLRESPESIWNHGTKKLLLFLSKARQNELFVGLVLASVVGLSLHHLDKINKGLQATTIQDKLVLSSAYDIYMEY